MNVAPPRGPSARLALAGIVVGAILVAVATVNVVPPLFRTVTSVRSLRSPGDTTLRLTAGRYVVLERTGTSTGDGDGGFIVTSNGPVTIDASHVLVTSAAGSTVRVTEAGQTGETVNRNSRVYTASLTFRIEDDGLYAIRVDTTTTPDLLVARSLRSAFSRLLGWIMLGAIGCLVGVLGIILLIIGVARRSRSGGPV